MELINHHLPFDARHLGGRGYYWVMRKELEEHKYRHYHQQSRFYELGMIETHHLNTVFLHRLEIYGVPDTD